MKLRAGGPQPAGAENGGRQRTGAAHSRAHAGGAARSRRHRADAPSSRWLAGDRHLLALLLNRAWVRSTRFRAPGTPPAPSAPARTGHGAEMPHTGDLPRRWSHQTAGSGPGRYGQPQNRSLGAASQAGGWYCKTHRHSFARKPRVWGIYSDFSVKLIDISVSYNVFCPVCRGIEHRAHPTAHPDRWIFPTPTPNRAKRGARGWMSAVTPTSFRK